MLAHVDAGKRWLSTKRPWASGERWSLRATIGTTYGTTKASRVLAYPVPSLSPSAVAERDRSETDARRQLQALVKPHLLGSWAGEGLPQSVNGNIEEVFVESIRVVLGILHENVHELNPRTLGWCADEEEWLLPSAGADDHGLNTGESSPTDAGLEVLRNSDAIWCHLRRRERPAG